MVLPIAVILVSVFFKVVLVSSFESSQYSIYREPLMNQTFPIMMVVPFIQYTVHPYIPRPFFHYVSQLSWSFTIVTVAAVIVAGIGEVLEQQFFFYTRSSNCSNKCVMNMQIKLKQMRRRKGEHGYWISKNFLKARQTTKHNRPTTFAQQIIRFEIITIESSMNILGQPLGISSFLFFLKQVFLVCLLKASIYLHIF